MQIDIISFVMSAENRKKIVRVLFANPKSQWSCSFMEDATKLPHATVFRALKGLRDFGVLRSHKVNRRDIVFELVSESPSTELLKKILDMERITAVPKITKTSNKKAQTATEYMIILAVVIIIAVIVVGVLGGIPGLGGGTKPEASRAYWQSAEVGIVSYAIDKDGRYTFMLRNNRQNAIAFTNITIDNECIWEGSKVIAPGETKAIQGVSAHHGNAGDRYNYDVNISYTDDETGSGYHLEGTEELIGNYATNQTIGNLATPALGLVAYYPFSEGSGGTTADMSGNGNTGTITGATWSTSCTSGSCLSFDGSDDYVQTNYPAAFGMSSFSISLWLKLNVVSRSGIIGNRLLGANIGGFNFWAQDGNLIASRISNTTTQVTPYTAIFQTNVWHYFAAVIDRSSNQIRLYIEGVQSGTPVSIAGFGNINNSINLRIGGNIGFYMNGSIDDVRIYNTALDPGTIYQQYLTGR